MQNVVSESGETVMETFNPDGTVRQDDGWHITLLGDQCVIWQGGVENGRYPRWMQPLLLQQHKAEYEKRYAGRGK